MFFGIMLIFSLITSNQNEAREHVDLIELNHFHDCLGKHVYDQLIFYDYSHEKNEYHVRGWILAEERNIKNPLSKNYKNNTYSVCWHDRDQNLNRHITSEFYRESWTQIDPERANKKKLDETLRVVFIKRIKPKPVIEEENKEAQEELTLEIE